MYSPVFLSCPTTSGSPPVLSISLSDRSFSVLASSFACTLAHSRPLWRFMFFSKRAFNALSSSSRCSGDNSFLLLLMLFMLLYYLCNKIKNYGGGKQCSRRCKSISICRRQRNKNTSIERIKAQRPLNQTLAIV